jgi:hypothetical protein
VSVGPGWLKEKEGTPMGILVNPKWKDKVEEALLDGKVVDETVSHAKAAQWLVMFLSSKGANFKVYNLGAGVRRITTETDVCPCCKRKMG